MQRVEARGVLTAKRVRETTRLDRLFQEGAAKIRLPSRTGEPLEAILINTAGGLTGGDRIAWRIEAGEGTSVAITTQACEKLYRSSAGRAEANCELVAGAGARLAWLPQETIAYDRSAFARRLDVELAEDAQLLLLEATVFGRRAMGETVGHAMFRDRWRVRCNGRLVHAEDVCIGPDVADLLSRTAVTGSATAMATLLLIGEDVGRHLEAARAIIGESGGVSAWSVGTTGKLLARLVAEDSYGLRARLIPLVEMLNGRAGLPKTWSL
ncbi:urease accessory protein UreD [Mesorhizobium sp. CAU 1741]|uniref:urease accessory protein UreD n=1 Tax=Mesorhizobium sp. CAU 1741 TaxID=3140366 RepID=UPI00325BF6D5